MGMAAAAAATMLTGGAVKGVGDILQGQAQREALRYNIKATREMQQENDLALHREAEIVRSSNIVGIAKSGVRRTGTPMEVLAAGAGEFARQRALNRLASDAQIEMLQYQRKQVNIATGISVASDLLGGTGQGAAALAMA